ncbi:MAG TPA: ABC transporter permease [Vicinamibacterales bacterium]|nr:ABC transporter permease [Vicinamibacterales bacterium]
MPRIDSVFADARFALRQLRTHAGFASAAVLTLALAIGATTAIFSVVYGVLLRPLPYRDPSRLVAIFEVNSKGRPARLADPNFDDFRDGNRSLQAIAKYSDYVASVSGPVEATRTDVARVSPQFLKVLGVQPRIGRDFTAADAVEGAGPTVLVSEGYWKQYLGARRDLAQLSLKVEGTMASVIGVLPAGFRFPREAELWMPADLEGENTHRTSHNYSAIGRLRDGASVAQAQADIGAIARRIHETSAEQGDYLLRDALVIPLRDSMAAPVRAPLLVLLAAVGFLLLVACANVANLLLAQASSRGRELAVRSALGAGRARLVRQLLTEAFVLAAAGGALGVAGASWGVSGLLALAPPGLPRLDAVGIDLPVLAFAIVLATAVAAGLGVFTAMRATAGDPREDLAGGGRGQAGSRASQRTSRVIVAVQIAVTVVLVVGAGLLGRSLLRVLGVNPGFRVDGIIAMDVSLPWRQDPASKVTQRTFFASLIDRVGRIPGVRAVGAASALPLDGGLPDGMFAIAGPNEVPATLADLASGPFRQPDRIGTADFCVATAGYFQALGIPLVRGRLFDARDGADAPHAALISESLARQRWPNQDPIGRTIEFGNMDGDLRLLTIVGIVGDTHEYGLDAAARPTVYVNLFQRPRPSLTLTILSDARTEQVVGAARRAVGDLDPEVPARFRTFPEVYAASIGSRRFNVVLVGFFGLAALALATIGVFGVMSYSVSRRRREIGVRVALGAARGDVLGLILGQASRTIAAGLAGGAALALVFGRGVQSLLFGVTATDPLTFGAAVLIIAAAALAACYVPARQAARVDPMAALRSE